MQTRKSSSRVSESSPATDAAEALRRVPLFADLSDEHMALICTHTRQRSFHSNQPLFRQDDIGLTLYVILSGSVRIERATAAGDSVFLARRGPGEHFGELALLDREPRMADSVTDTPCELLMLERDAFLSVLHQSPALMQTVLASLARRLREAGAHTESQQELTVAGRLAQSLLRMAAHGEQQPDGSIRITLPGTHQQMAEEIGARRETVTRELGRLRLPHRRGELPSIRIEGHGTLYIVNAQRLKQLCER